MNPPANDPITVVDYDPAWPALYQAIAAKLAAALDGVAVTMEHVGSTSVPGLAAKPVIDIDIALHLQEDFDEVRRRLESIGYAWRGDLGIPERVAFVEPAGAPRHNLYVCYPGAVAFENHRRVRDWLRLHPHDKAAYAALKRELAQRHPRDIDAYCVGKTGFLAEVLRKSGMAPDVVAGIEAANTMGRDKE